MWYTHIDLDLADADVDIPRLQIRLDKLVAELVNAEERRCLNALSIPIGGSGPLSALHKYVV